MYRIIIAILTIILCVTTISYASDHVLIIGGVGGEKSYYDQFWSGTSRFYQLLTQEYGFSPDQIHFHFEDEGSIPGIVTGDSKREPVLQTFALLAERIQPTDRFILFMVGHASRNQSGIKFNLPGRDISQQEYTDSINKIQAKEQLLVFGFPYSARIVQGVSAEGRIIITSSSQREGYASQAGFGDLFVDSFSESTADTNADGTISILESYNWLQIRIEEWYTQDGAIQAEHPHLEDNGDGRASRDDVTSNGDGKLAENTYLGQRITPLPPPEHNLSETTDEDNDNPEETNSEDNVADNTQDTQEEEKSRITTKSSLPFNFVSDNDEEIIQEAIQNVPSKPENSKNEAVVLWETEVYDIDEDGKHVYSTRRVIKIYNDEGYHLGEVRIPYTVGTDDVTIHHARTLHPDGTIIEFDKDKIVSGITPSEATSAGLTVNTRLMFLRLPKLTDGCVIDYAYSTKNPQSAMKGAFWRQVFFQVDIPVQFYRLTTHIPKKLNLKYQVNGPTIEPTITENNYTRTHIFETKDISPLREEPMMPAISDFAYNISFSTIESWEKLLQWYATLIREQDRITEDITNKTNELLFGALTRKEKIKRLYNFVATTIMYAGDERGIWGIKPYPAAKVLEEEWGDCKGKSTLLSTMLRVAGIDSYPVLISSGKASRIIPDVPSLAYFNHMILAVDGGKNKDIIWLDPTAQTTAYGDFPVSDQNRWTLIINTDAPTTEGISIDKNLEDLQKVDGQTLKNHLYTFQKSPALPADSNIRLTNANITVREDLSVEVVQEATFTGDFNAKFRAHLLRRSHRGQRISFLRDAFEIDERARIENFETSDLKELEPELKIKLTWTCNDYIYKMGDQYILELPVVDHPYAQLLRDEKRDHPAALGKAVTFEDHVTVEVDKPFKIKMVPETKKLHTDVAEIQLNYKESRSKAEMERIVRFNSPTVDMDQFHNLRNVVKVTSNQSTKTFILIQDP
ncbi:DUF3857 and transglutaminase domain-containing protein [Candidatus Poribacteria bacterium]|nr:DUF3857 and transglutaminase domain-containing protein [Candidatus Poribacteria bacterium]